MRDHQIVISLKPEQFQQLQELARAAGAKSVGTFLREQMLSTLGVSGDASTHSAVPNWQLIGGQIRRLHRELQLFIAESSNMPEELGEFPFMVQKDSVIAQDDSDDSDEAHSTPTANPAAQAPAPPPEQVSTTAPQPKVPPKPPEPAVDPMEALADRAFAISPRLGALDDPLQDLLADSPLSQSDEEDDEMDDDEEESFAQAPAPQKEQSAGEDDADDDSYQIDLLAEPDETDTAYDAGAKLTLPQPPPKRGLEGENEDESEGFANPPPLSGGPPPRKPRT
jgi:hypothetical protein